MSLSNVIDINVDIPVDRDPQPRLVHTHQRNDVLMLKLGPDVYFIESTLWAVTSIDKLVFTAIPLFEPRSLARRITE